MGVCEMSLAMRISSFHVADDGFFCRYQAITKPSKTSQEGKKGPATAGQAPLPTPYRYGPIPSSLGDTTRPPGCRLPFLESTDPELCQRRTLNHATSSHGSAAFLCSGLGGRIPKVFGSMQFVCLRGG